MFHLLGLNQHTNQSKHVLSLCLYETINISYRDEKSVSSFLTDESFAVLFWALGIVLANTWPCPPAKHRSPAVQSAFPYMVMLTVRQWRFGSILTEDALPPSLFLSRYIIKLCKLRKGRAWKYCRPAWCELARFWALHPPDPAANAANAETEFRNHPAQGSDSL